ncbi:MAG: serine/threonine-protein phosphatase [Leptospira sp.]|nr:serine/threonine-protein phosphatase [Leptospira sp.]
MMMVQTSIHLLLSKKETFSPAGMLKILIEGIEENIRKITRHQYKYMTITILSYDEKGEFTFAGQHQDLLIYRSQSGKIERIETEGIWIGLGNLAEDKDKLIQNKIFRMEQNDILLLYTDGITEGIDENGKEFGVEGLAEILRENGTKTPAEIRNSINSTMKKFKTTDDISFLIMKKSV